MLFCPDIKICRDLRTFWKTWGQKSLFFGTATLFLVQVRYYSLHGIYAYYTELNLQIAITHKNDAFVAKIANMRLTKIFVGSFALPERLSNSATLVNDSIFLEPVFGLIYEI